ncbi:uncharacterized protein LOC106154597 [Lingula anatina]|uniref:Uncharacterized protein LOC106154597 n=1 Tax=Lingula anatina TaxID=7574 RepID=A0A1S3HEE8_LINAN|nr:uncharacterized protein LOC106154597 [Lingula anatina]XP_013384447.1 uncharacterized protein LOC106154597 [Lingula anatina]XP_013384448.1 uncharacterized protein LOC106154597 [Lingula anatina]|eukprot:XP_013384446.1 uncharacterized protein LOC106154597 [Lingula anatina]
MFLTKAKETVHLWSDAKLRYVHCAGLWIGFWLTIVSVVLLVTLSGVYAKGYFDMQAFKRLRCTVWDIYYRLDEVKCTGCQRHLVVNDTVVCARDRNHTLPCLLVVVTYNAGNGTQKGYLYDDLVAMDSTSRSKCSYTPACQEDPTKEWTNLRHFRDQYDALGSSFECYQNPANVSQFISHVVCSEACAVNVILWPLLLTIASFVLCLLGILSGEEQDRREQFVRKKRAPCRGWVPGCTASNSVPSVSTMSSTLSVHTAASSRALDSTSHKSIISAYSETPV